jgi:hypothetical protein
VRGLHPGAWALRSTAAGGITADAMSTSTWFRISTSLMRATLELGMPNCALLCADWAVIGDRTVATINLTYAQDKLFGSQFFTGYARYHFFEFPSEMALLTVSMVRGDDRNILM